MALHKSVILSLLATLFAFPYTAFAEDGPGDVIIHHDNYTEGEGDDSHLRHMMKQHLAQFLAELPQDPQEALKYIFNKINKAEATIPTSSSMQFSLSVVDSLARAKLWISVLILTVIN